MIHRNYVAGEWNDAGDVVPDVNPADTSEIVGEFTYANRAVADAAIDAAEAAFPKWRGVPPQRKAEMLEAVGNALAGKAAELARLMTREEGKTYAESSLEITRAANIFKFFAGEALRPEGELVPSVRAGVMCEITREPLGVVGLIAPWNFPAAIPAWKIAPALAHGNTVVFKPAELVPATAHAIATAIAATGFPPGVFNLVMGTGAEVGDAVARSPKTAALSFTGSQRTGTRLREVVTGRGGKIQLEMGGKNALVVLADADLDHAVECALDGSFFSTGQRCTASSRLVIQDCIHDRFVTALVARLKQVKVGNGLDPDVGIGPVVDQKQMDQNLGYIEIGTREGAHLAYGGERLSMPTEGFFLQPTLFTETSPSMRINREEIFGPVASVIRVGDLEEAIDVVNGVEFGLTAGICTTSLANAAAFKAQAEVGMVMVNLPTAGVDYHVPFGGRKASSYGPREQGRFAREFYTIVKTAYVRAA